MAQQRAGRSWGAKAPLAQAQAIPATTLPQAESTDLGHGAVDWMIARVLLDEAKGVVENIPGTLPRNAEWRMISSFGALYAHQKGPEAPPSA